MGRVPTVLLATDSGQTYMQHAIRKAPALLLAPDIQCAFVQHAMDNGWLMDREGKPKLVALLSSAHEASLGLAQLHRGGVIHGGLSPATCFLKAARNQRGFVVKVRSVVRYFGA